MRSLPPAVRSSLAYSSTLHSASIPNCAKARLKPTRCASRSVSTSTPSQSKIIALTTQYSSGRVGELAQERAAAILAAELLDEPVEHRLARLILGIAHAQRLIILGVGEVIIDEALHPH